MKATWTKMGNGHYRNLHAAVEVYRTASQSWYARNTRTDETSGPAESMRAAKIRAYEIVGHS